MPAHRSRLVVAVLLVALLGIAQVESHGHEHGDHPVVEPQRRDLGAVSRVSRLGSLASEAGPWNGFKALLDAQLGDVRAGMASLKAYLLQFGYISTTDAPPAGSAFTDTFDNITQTAIMNYQRSFSLGVTGRLDVATLTQMIIPRCGRKDVFNGTLIMLQRGLSNATANPDGGTQHVSTGTQHWASFAGSPRWTRRNLTYAINTLVLSPDVSQVDTEIAIDTAFAQWASVTDLNFTRIQLVAAADIQVSFDLLDHGDGNAFDGRLGVLAHAFAPEDGRLHFDNSETWTVNIRKSTSTLDFDLVSVAVHEIGHIIGLEHSNVADAIMYPSIVALSANQVLHADDIEGAQALYGVNPTYMPGSSTPGTTLGNQSAAVASWRRLRALDVALSCWGLLVTGFLFA